MKKSLENGSKVETHWETMSIPLGGMAHDIIGQDR